MQSSSSSRIVNPTLAGASPATDASLVDSSWLIVDSSEIHRVRQWVYQLSTLYQQSSQGVISSARRSAKAEARGALPFATAKQFRWGNHIARLGKSTPRESSNVKAPVPQQLQGELRKLVFVGASPTMDAKRQTTRAEA